MALTPLRGPDTSGSEFTTKSRGDQPALFPTEDLIIPETLRSMRKSISAIFAVPSKAEHNHSLASHRLFDAAILVAQIEMKQRGPDFLRRVREDRVSPIFETRVTDLARLAGIPGKNYERLREALDLLYAMDLTWNIVDDNQVDFKMRAHFFSMLGYGEGKSRGLVRFSMDPSILEIVLEPKHWAALSLPAMKGLGTSPSYALYQACFRYVGTASKMTAALDVQDWILLLVGQSHYVKEVEPGRYEVAYADFRRRVLNDAIERVNNVAALDYTLELKEHRSGRRVSKLQFKLVPKAQRRLDLELTWPPAAIDVLKGLGFTDSGVLDLSQAHSYEEVADALERLRAQAEKKRAAGGLPIGARKAYFLGILANISKGVALAEINEEEVEREARAKAESLAAEDRQERMREAFAAHQSKVANARLFELDEQDRQALFDEYEASSSFASARILASRGWSPSNVGALAMFRGWLLKARPERYAELLRDPQDQSFEAWTAWRIEELSQGT